MPNKYNLNSVTYKKRKGMEKDTVLNPIIGSIVEHTGWGKEDNENYPCDVLIRSGQYLSNGRISNFWYWQRIDKNGNLVEDTECGYGSFVKSKNGYTIITKVIRDENTDY